MTAQAATAILSDEKFRIDPQVRDGKTVVYLSGVIDEDAKFEELRKLQGSLVFNFRDLHSLNSCGVRSWVNLLKELANTEIYYEECTPLVVRQMNMVPSFVSHAVVLSVYVPYVCENCEEEKLILVEHDAFQSKPVKIKEVIPCEFCKQGEMELDGHPEQYFAFAKS